MKRLPEPVMLVELLQRMYGPINTNKCILILGFFVWMACCDVFVSMRGVEVGRGGVIQIDTGLFKGEIRHFWRELQCVAMCCSVLRCAGLCCSVF